MRVDSCAPSLIWISMRMMAKPSSVLRLFRPSTKVLVVDSAAEMSSNRFSRSLQTASMVVG